MGWHFKNDISGMLEEIAAKLRQFYVCTFSMFSIMRILIVCRYNNIFHIHNIHSTKRTIFDTYVLMWNIFNIKMMS